MKVLVPLAEGFEEIEAVTIIDILRRAKIEVVTAALDRNPVTGSHAITVTADTILDKVSADDFGAIVLPGGMPGSKNLKASAPLLQMIRDIPNNRGYAAAICAAPIVLGAAGILQGKKASCYPGYEAELIDASVQPASVVTDGLVITGKGAGAAIDFALTLVEHFTDEATADNLRRALQVFW
jgi:4-methyl-5(b-hydroxyethyl)-thiazole monophosphate biosynthesis